MVLRGNRFLDSVKLQALVQTMADQLEYNQNHVFLERTPIVPADDNEILGKFKGTSFAADIIADGQKAVVRNRSQFEFTTTQIPNIKNGFAADQGMINRINRMGRNLIMQGDEGFFSQWENKVAEGLVKGIRDRVNALICAMQLDSANYSRMGIVLQNVSWGMPADLKVTPSVGWDDATNATPITDLQVVLTQTAPDLYGEAYNRVTMTSRAFRYLTNTVEFRNKVSGELRFPFSAGQLNPNDVGHMRQLLSNILDATIEVYDGTIWEESVTGAMVRSKVLPNNKVILSNTADDNNASAMDFANGIVTESVVGTLVGMEGFNGEAFGPVTYWTADESLNAPGLEAWCVLRGFPRKIRETATAVLTVGSGSAWN